MPLKLSRRVARFNRAITNPVQGTYAWLLVPWAVICHRGRHSGQFYRTPVNAYKHGPQLAIVILYGANSDWVQNLLAGGGLVVRAGRTYELRQPRIVDPGSQPVLGVAGVIGRLSRQVLVAELGPPRPGFGRGPGAGR
jgi:deazaflavin-dependent oxidoreductase (nitroreductase family)